MIILLYGQDTYRSRQKLSEIIEHYQKTHKSGLNLKYFDFKEDSYQNFRDEIKSISMFAGKKLIVLKNAISNEDFKANFLKEAKNFLDLKDIILFHEEKEIPPNDQLFKFIKKFGKLQEFKLLEEKTLKNWAKKEFEKEKVKIEPLALTQLINYVGNDLWQLSGEIKKLTAYAIKERAPAIREKDIDLLVKPKIELDIFKTIDAISSKNKKEALSLIHQHLEKGDSPLYVLAMINFQFRNILMIKSRCQFLNYLGAKKINELSKEFKLHPFVIKKSFWQSKRFQLEELRKIYQLIFEKDFAIKTGKINPEIALDTLIAEI